MRLERMPVSTWNMMVWAGMMASDLIRVASKVPKTNGIKGAHGLCKLKQLCSEWFALGCICAKSLDAVPHCASSSCAI